MRFEIQCVYSEVSRGRVPKLLAARDEMLFKPRLLKYEIPTKT